MGTDGAPSQVERLTVDGGRVLDRVTSLTGAQVEDGAYINSWRNIHYPPTGARSWVLAAICWGGDCGGLGFADVYVP